MQLETWLEQVLAHATDVDAGLDLRAARERFESSFVPLEDGSSWYEEAIRVFLDWYVCEWARDKHSGPIDRYLLQRGFVPSAERTMAFAVATSARSLYETTSIEGNELVVHDHIGDGSFRVLREPGTSAERIRIGDVFDGRLAALEDHIELLPGVAFHPRIAHEALGALLIEAERTGARDARLLDGLLRMRFQLERFSGMRAQHIYRFEALGMTIHAPHHGRPHAKPAPERNASRYNPKSQARARRSEPHRNTHKQPNVSRKPATPPHPKTASRRRARWGGYLLPREACAEGGERGSPKTKTTRSSRALHESYVCVEESVSRVLFLRTSPQRRRRSFI